MNYLEHETEVKYVDGLLAHSQEWQWLIEKIQERFEVKEVDSWEEYLNESIAMRRMFQYFVKVLEVCDGEWKYRKVIHAEIWEIAKFYIGKISLDVCMQKVSYNVCKLFLLCVWITKLEKKDNEFEILYDIRLLSEKNYFQLINCESLREHEQEIMGYTETFQVRGMEVPLKCLEDNINQMEYLSDHDFLERYENVIVSYNAFSYQRIDEQECKTWQEEYLLDMLKVSFIGKKIQPMFTGSNGNVPEISMWSKDILKDMKNYFQDIRADFVLETISYFLFSTEPSKRIKLLHCRVLSEVINREEEHFKIFNSSSYVFLACMHKDKQMKECGQEAEYINLLQEIQKWEEPDRILKLKEDGYPTSRMQKEKAAQYLENKFKEVENISEIWELQKYIENTIVAGEITMEYFRVLCQKFRSCIKDKTDISVATVYYRYMLFLIEINKNNKSIDKRYLQKEMIQTQESWQNFAYSEQCKNMQKFSYEHTFEKRELAKFSEQALTNPIVFAGLCTPCSEKELLNIMTSASESVLVYLVNRMELNAVFPREKAIIYERHDIDKLLLNYVTVLEEKKGYKLLNKLEPTVFMEAIHERFFENTQCYVAIFSEEEKLYQMIKRECKVKLIPYSKRISLALLTQLFPVLEIKIRELAKLLGVFPFKKSKEEFMQYNDPSSLLREILGRVYEAQQSFENVSDLMFVYQMMYNGNSCNIRNECVHGRNYLAGGSLRFAFRVTLFAIYMIDFRIKTIKQNVSDIQDI